MKNCKENGNVLVYILLAVALFAALTFAIGGDQRGQQTTQLDSARAKLLATDLIKHAVAAEQAVYMMAQFGVDFDEIRFNLPGTAGYLTDITKQIYHPSGGGLNLMDEDKYFESLSPATRGWSWENDQNVEWSQTTSSDIIFTFIDINKEICENINSQINGEFIIYPSTVNYWSNFVDSGVDSDFLSSECSDCVNKKSACISNSGVNQYAFYNIIGSR